MKRKILANIIFWLHGSIIIFWIALFFIPKGLWPGKIKFHFLLSLLIFGHQLLWGLLILPWTKKYRMVCCLTTIMQLLRGQNISDPKNYDHSFTVEFLNKIMGINVTHKFSTILTLTILFLTTIQYFLFR